MIKRFIIGLAALALLFGTALADDDDVSGYQTSGAEYEDQVGSEVSQEVEIEIPERYVLHLPARYADFELHLDRLELGHPDYTCVIVPTWKDGQEVTPTYRGAEGLLRAAIRGDLDTHTRTANYPAYADGPDAEFEKGYLFCYWQKVVQKFVNVDNCDCDRDWMLDLNITVKGGEAHPSVGEFFLIDHYKGKLVALGGIDGMEYHDRDRIGFGHTRGWQDDIVYEGIFLDGTETAGEYEMDVTFTIMPFQASGTP